MLKELYNETGTGEGRPPQKLPEVDVLAVGVLLVLEVEVLLVLAVDVLLLLEVEVLLVLEVEVLVVFVVVELLVPEHLAPVQYTVITVETEEVL